MAALGIFVALVLVPPIRASHRTIDKWLLKQRKRFKGKAELSDLALDGDRLEGIEEDPLRDRGHVHSLMFSNLAPWAFLLFWVLALICAAL